MSNFASPVHRYMSRPVHTVPASAPLSEAHDQLERHRISSLAVVGDDERPVGVISRSDLIRVGRRDATRAPHAAVLTLPEQNVEAEMTSPITSVEFDATIREASRKMLEARVHRVFVLEDGELVGVLSTKDVMSAVSAEKVRRPISDYMSSPVFTIRAEEPLALGVERLERAHVHGIIVVDEGWPVGVFTQVESLAAENMPRNTRIEEVMNPAMLCLPADTWVHRAAAQAAATRTRRVIATEGKKMCGILTGLDFARATLAS